MSLLRAHRAREEHRRRMEAAFLTDAIDLQLRAARYHADPAMWGATRAWMFQAQRARRRALWGRS